MNTHTLVLENIEAVWRVVNEHGVYNMPAEERRSYIDVMLPMREVLIRRLPSEPRLYPGVVRLDELIARLSVSLAMPPSVLCATPVII
uniref:Uncharacterized protein n=1 Tax=viral metagenome TaxID=1070528 RepID=A0A6C0JVZ0_9ZZZZ